MQYGKYKKANGIARCAKCENKTIFKSYRKICDPCSDLYKICAKCLEEKELSQGKKGVNKEALKEMEDLLASLRERCKRTLLRQIDKGIAEWDFEKSCFIFTEDGR